MSEKAMPEFFAAHRERLEAASNCPAVLDPPLPAEEPWRF